jgi:segregation and condensation protein A
MQPATAPAGVTLTEWAVDHGAEAPPAALFVVDLDGFEGPLDLLLALARADRLDLRAISIQALADQYLAYIARAHRANLDVAAEYLVMAAWLAYLKSRLLLPQPPAAEEPSGDAMAEALASQLRRLALVRALGQRLMAQPQRGIDVFPRGRPEALSGPVVHELRADLFDLLAAYGRHLRRRRGPPPLALPVLDLDRVDDAIRRMLAALGAAPGWENLSRFLPEGTIDGLRRGDLKARSGLASTFVASLELARQHVIQLRQARPFGPIALLALDPPARERGISDERPDTDRPAGGAGRDRAAERDRP